MRYLLLLPLSILMTLLAYVLAPVLPLFSGRRIIDVDDERNLVIRHFLPKWLSWFQTPDNPLEGDEGHQARWEGKAKYPQMVAWLWRNPAYGFEWDGPLAATLKESDPIFTKGNPLIKNRFNAIAGWYFCRVGEYWNFKAVVPGFLGIAAFLLTWCAIFDLLLPAGWIVLDAYAALIVLAGLVWPLQRDLAFMPEFGWKLQGFAQGRETEGKAMYVFSIRLTAFNP